VRALIVGAAAVATERFLADLAVRCDLVIAADGGGGACLSAGVAPNVVVGDLDSLDAADERCLRTAGTSFVIAPVDKDVSDFDLALDEARRAGATEVWATGVFGQRLDHTLASIGSLVRCADMGPSVREPDVTAWLLSPLGRSRLALCGKGEIVSLFAVSPGARVSCDGYRYPLVRETLPALDSRGLSNVIEAAVATIEVFDGAILALCVLTNGMPPASECDTRENNE